jgi:hypothetical protein
LTEAIFHYNRFRLYMVEVTNKYKHNNSINYYCKTVKLSLYELCYNVLFKIVHLWEDDRWLDEPLSEQANTTSPGNRGAQKLTGEYLKLVWAEFSTIS